MTNQRRNSLIELPPMPDGTCATEVGGSEHNPKIYFESDMREYARAALQSAAQSQPSGNVGEDERLEFERFWNQEMNVVEMDLHRCNFPMTPYEKQPYACHETERSWLAWQARAALAQQGAEKVDAALAEMVHAMFRSGNDVPVPRITIDRKQYEAAVNAGRKEQE